MRRTISCRYQPLGSPAQPPISAVEVVPQFRVVACLALDVPSPLRAEKCYDPDKFTAVFSTQISPKFGDEIMPWLLWDDDGWNEKKWVAGIIQCNFNQLRLHHNEWRYLILPNCCTAFLAADTLEWFQPRNINPRQKSINLIDNAWSFEFSLVVIFVRRLK